jgi:hypothetical protein
MRPFFLGIAAIVVVAIISLSAPLAHGADAACRPFHIPAEIELPAGELALADLFPEGACSAILSAAREVRLGSVPLAGSPRVLTHEEIRLMLAKLGERAHLALQLIALPERTTVRRNDEQETIADTLSRQAGRSQAARSLAERSPPKRPGTVNPAATAPAADRIVRPGQTVTLIWDQDGIRVQVPALCLDPGVSGSQVRARILQSGMVVRATVVGARSLRIRS